MKTNFHISGVLRQLNLGLLSFENAFIYHHHVSCTFSAVRAFHINKYMRESIYIRREQNIYKIAVLLHRAPVDASIRRFMHRCLY